MLYAAKSHIGLVRQMNQDAFAIYPHLEPQAFIVVADGMGGASAGEVASRMAIETVSQYVLGAMHSQSDVTTPQILEEAISAANHEIWQAARTNLAYIGMGTTLVASFYDAQHVVLGNVGDSRGYLFQAGEMMQVTRDHSLVAELVRIGQLTEEEALHHPQRSIVTKSLGTAEFSQPDVDAVTWTVGDMMLLCSDGLSNLVSSVELALYLTRLNDASSNTQVERVVDDLIRLALERGGPDNITLVIVVNTEVGETL